MKFELINLNEILKSVLPKKDAFLRFLFYPVPALEIF